MIETFKTLSFANYYALYALLILPIVYFVLKSYPPSPIRLNFSSLYLIKDINNYSHTKEKCPIWLLLFRLLIIILLIIFFSKPYSYKNNIQSGYKSYVILADKGWSIASKWDSYKKIIENIALEAEKLNKELFFYHPMMNANQKPFKFSNTSDLLLYLKNLSPSPWQTNRTKLVKEINDNNFFKNSKVFFIFSKYDSLSFNKQVDFLELLKKKVPHIEIITPVNNIKIINKYKISEDSIEFVIERFGLLKKEKIAIKISSEEGLILYKKDFFFKKGIDKIKVRELFPLEIINQFFKIEISETSHAAAAIFLDDFDKKKNIGILTEDTNYIEKPLLSPVYYIKKAIKEDHNVFLNDLDNLLKENPSVIIFPESKKFDKKNRELILGWLNNGGLLIKFASNKSIYNKNIYFNSKNIPPSIRYLGGDLSWEKDLNIKAFSDNSIFRNILVPKNIVIKKQLIFSKMDQIGIKVLAQLEDETPLITMRKVGNGKVLLFHFTANNDWTNIPMSNIFVEFLSKALLLSKLQNSNSSDTLQIKSQINGFGFLEDSTDIKSFESISLLKNAIPSENALPGVYDNKDLAITLNLSGKIITNNFNINTYKNFNIKSYYENNVYDYSSFFLILVMLMLLIDILISSSLKNNFFLLKLVRRKTNVLPFLLTFLIFSFLDNSKANEYINNTFLAYIKIEDQNRNDISRDGLNALKETLIRRTSVSPKGVVGIDINKDPIFYYPFIYWPIEDKFLNINEQAKIKIKNYFKSGGIVLFDILKFDRNTPLINSKSYLLIKNFLMNIGVEDLNYIKNSHTISKSFYLLKKFPGRWDNKILLVDNNDLNLKDGVNSIIIGFNDWAGAWALDNNKYPLFPVVPGGERQREIAYRFGINIMMYALTGNYKSDQVHSKSILNRIKK